jgi:tetraacyldisaccharide 4'-kinase
MSWLERSWYAPHRSPLTLLLLPLAGVYCLLSLVRRLTYRCRLARTHRLSVPVIVVGNITVGGTGKTPLVIWLARYLRELGYHPGIVSRGYGGRSPSWPVAVDADSDPAMVGDEPVLLARHSECPVCVGPDRVRAARQLLREQPCDVLLSDDGLQHLRMERDIEIAVVDGERRLGNGLCLPAGPLREPARRLRRVDLVVVNGGRPEPGEFVMTLRDQALVRLSDGSTRPADSVRGETVHAVAGIGSPQRFFSQLERLGAHVIRHAFPDHHPFVATDLDFASDGRSLIMTEKDAVKCRSFADERCWYLAVAAEPEMAFAARLQALLREKTSGSKAA